MSQHEFKIHFSTEWNTRRLYRSDGQPIAAYVCALGEDRFVFFRDRARMIDGLIGTSTFENRISQAQEQYFVDAFEKLNSPSQLKRYVMECYDNNLYDMWRAGGEHGISTIQVANLIKETTGEYA